MIYDKIVTMEISKERVKRAFVSYVSNYDRSDTKVELKVIHTYKVADLCDEIAASLGLETADRNLAWLLGMLHDIGRFEQLRRYHTFRDKDSMDHADLGTEILFTEGLISQFADEDPEYLLMEKAIRFHNCLELPPMSQREYMYSTILRDADKIDILRVNCEASRSDIYGISDEEFYRSAISDEVLADLQNRRTVNRKHAKTAMDFLLGHVSFVFGLVHPYSIQIMAKQGYLENMLTFESRNADTQEKMRAIRSWVRTYLKTGLGRQSDPKTTETLHTVK